METRFLRINPSKLPPLPRALFKASRLSRRATDQSRQVFAWPKLHESLNAKGEEVQERTIGLLVGVSRDTMLRFRFVNSKTEHSAFFDAKYLDAVEASRLRRGETDASLGYGPIKLWNTMSSTLPAVKVLTERHVSKGHGALVEWSQELSSQIAIELQELLTSDAGINESHFVVHDSKPSFLEAIKGGQRLSMDYGIGSRDWLLAVQERVQEYRRAPSEEVTRLFKAMVFLTGEQFDPAVVRSFFYRDPSGETIPSVFSDLVNALGQTKEMISSSDFGLIAKPKSSWDALDALCDLSEGDSALSLTERLLLDKTRDKDAQKGSSDDSTIARTNAINHSLRCLSTLMSDGAENSMRLVALPSLELRDRFAACQEVIVSET